MHPTSIFVDTMLSFTITRVTTQQDVTDVTALVLEYMEHLGNGFETLLGFKSELADILAKYKPPQGVLLLARDEDGRAVGCSGYYNLGDGRVAEMKRLFVSPVARGHGFGKMLAQAAIEEARIAGFEVIKCDTLPRMKSAAALYPLLGFKPTTNYNGNPFSDALFFEKQLVV